MKGHVLIVDDNINNLRIAVDILIHENLKIATAKSGKDALKALERNKIDLILLDINMPEMDGFETLKKMRAIPDYNHIPVLFVTSHTDEDFIQRGFKSGCVDYISKPFRPAEFISRVNSHLSLAKYRHDLQKAIDEKTDLLQVTIKELEASKKAKDTFLTVMSHELRTPLNGILGMTSLLKIPEMENNREDIINDLETSTRRLNRLINDILDFCTIDTPKASTYASGILISEFVMQVEYISQCRQEYNIKFNIAVSPSIPEEIKIDSKSALKVIECIVDNAFKFTEKGKVSVDISYKSINSENGILVVDVHDSGLGIKEENFPEVFEKFFQLDSSLTRCYEGSGIGLAIADKLIKAMKGSISIESKLGQGSTFTIEFPVSIGRTASSPPKSRHISESNLLIVEDVPTNQAFLSRLLSLKNANVFIASDHKECFEIMGKEKIDLIFMDYMLPEMNGVEITKRIRAEKMGNSNLPIIAVTAKVDEVSREECLESGMDSFVSKPYFASEIFSCLSHYFKMD